MSWTIIRAIQSRPLFRLCTRHDVLRLSSSTQQSPKNKNLPSDLRISKLFEKNVPITETDWSRIRENFLKSPTIKTTNVDQVIVDFCERNNAFDNAVSYVEFLRTNNINVDQRLKLKVIQLYVNAICEGPVSAELQAKAIELCESIIKASSTLKHATAVSLFVALSSTPEWRRCIDLFDQYDIKCSNSTVPTFSLLVANAFWENEASIGWRLLDAIAEMDFAPQCISFLAYWNYCTLHRDDKFIERIEQMLEYIGVNDVLVSRDVLDGLQAAVEEIVLTQTEIDYSGVCSTCQQQLDDVRLSSIEFQKLKKEFEKTSLSKENILAHSSQSELIRFKQHVNKKRNFHYVIDGLNVALIVPNNVLEQAKTLAKIVEQFVQRRKRVLVIGRKHMETQWPERQMNYIKTHADVFFTANESDDDPYLLYATLVSGEYTDFVTRDQMRNYALRLSPTGRLLFKQWQKQHQNVPIVDERNENPIKIQRPPKYKHFCHKNALQQWHVPFVEKPAVKLGRYWEAKVHWACFKFENSNSTVESN